MQHKTYLLDTHCLLWFQELNAKMPTHIMQIVQNTENEILFSQISLFEIAIKLKIGKFPDLKSDVHDIYGQAIKDDFTFCL